MCEILNPIYLYRIMRVFKPVVNGLENAYFPEDFNEGFSDYLMPTDRLTWYRCLIIFRDFIARARVQKSYRCRIAQESVGRHLLLAYLDEFVRRIGGVDAHRSPNRAWQMDLLITHNQRKYVVETKIWRGAVRYLAGKSS